MLSCIQTPRVYASKVKNAQEAHEAIRPAGHPFQLPETLRGELDHDQFRLFDMIWKRTIACQMADANKERVTVTIESSGAVFQASGTTIKFEGFLRAYVEGSDDPDAELAQQEVLLPAMQEGDRLDLKQLDAKSHTTQPPARFTEASLTRTLEERGIGRPSTYASIIDTIQNREYVFKKGNALVPSWTAFAVIRLLEEHLGSFVDYDFTAQMEDYLDSISRNEHGFIEYLKDFYFAPEKGLKPLLETKVKEIDARETNRFRLTGADKTDADEVVVRVGRYGPFVEQGERKASLPNEMAPDEITLEKAMELLAGAAKNEEPLGHQPDTGKPIYLKSGRFGPYIQLGDNDDEEKRNASILKSMNPAEITLDMALKLLSLPRTLGNHPELGEPVVALSGPYGPYVKCGKETRNLGSVSPIDVTFEEALALLAQPKANARGRAAAKREPIKTFENSPITGKPIELLEGRYGPYVSDGETNASLPKESDPAELTFNQAVDLLAARAAAGGSKKKARRGVKKAASDKPAKKAPAKKAATKKAPKKAAAKKKKSE